MLSPTPRYLSPAAGYIHGIELPVTRGRSVLMLFHSFPYVLGFLPVVLIVHAILAERAEDSRRNTILQASLAGNILFLCCFKYANFLLGALPHGYRLTLPEWSLPLGISFFTLTQVMSLVDTYQGLNGPSSLFDHATMVSLFPYVISGPLVSSRSIVPQLHEWKLREGRMDAVCRGLYLFAIGLTKKVVFADSFAAVADAGYRSTVSLSSIEAWVATLILGVRPIRHVGNGTHPERQQHSADTFRACDRHTNHAKQPGGE